jgi:hypothetical protein
VDLKSNLFNKTLNCSEWTYKKKAVWDCP